MTDWNRHGPVTSPRPPLSRFDGRAFPLRLTSLLLPYPDSPSPLLSHGNRDCLGSQPWLTSFVPAPPNPSVDACCVLQFRLLCSLLSASHRRLAARTRRVIYHSGRHRRHRRPAVGAAAATPSGRDELSLDCWPSAQRDQPERAPVPAQSNVAGTLSLFSGFLPDRRGDCDHAR
ncbi:hypothetical protein L227DRAFT_26596 [Lentinus tigrinus ALCF2SS1-6]|uniref:Uncharacterized protein n=1 Tax=Lentinus tigrinus ALCF2SS1-6 TaxID=1328759 RepID=A0A5C2SY12_9APHY|nr:hypothetical protein L227DRAFT_26596 [Lentinus tigrinus ALCF2SS1-6]